MPSSLFFKNYKREISCRVTNTIIKYVQSQGKKITSLLAGLPCNEQYLTDTNNWISKELSDEIYRRLKLMFDDDQIAYRVALSSEKLHSLGFIDYVTRLMGNPNFVIKNAPMLNKYFSRVEEIEILKYGLSGATIKYYAKEGFTVRMDDCNYVKGTLAALPGIWGVGKAHLFEEQCCVPIDQRGRIYGKYWTIDEKRNVLEYRTDRDLGERNPRIIGRLNDDGTFKMGKTIYGAKSCIYHISWDPVKMFLSRIFYELFKKPRFLMKTIDEIHRANDIILEKYEELYHSNYKLQQYYVDAINSLIRAIDAKDHYTESHSKNVSRIAEAVAKRLELPDKKVEMILRACKLHDLGKIGIKESTLFKPGELTEEEWEEMKKHPILGAEIVKPLTFLSDVAVLIREDHERWDGKGYPDGLKGEDIDIGARIIMISDAYDAMRSGRPYKKPMTKEEVLEEIKKNSGTQFDPKVVEAFLDISFDLS